MFKFLKKPATPDTRLETFAKVEAENVKEFAVAARYLGGADPHVEVTKALNSLRLNPLDTELADRAIALAARWESERPIRTMIAGIVAPALQLRILDRLKPAAAGVFESVAERLAAELAEVQAQDAKRAGKYGVAPRPSAEAEALAAELERVKNYHAQVTAPGCTLNAETIRALVAEVTA